jgi:GNAT superfamily N-acetyltransferase
MANLPMTDPIIRASEPADAEAIETVRIAAWKVGFQGILADAFLETLRGDARQRRESIQSRQLQNGADLVAVVEEHIVGWVSGGPTRDADLNAASVELYACYVHPEFWRHGLGRALLLAALEKLDGDRSAVTTGWVLARNERMLKLMRSLGFEPDGAERFFDSGGLARLVRTVRPRSRS